MIELNDHRTGECEMADDNVECNKCGMLYKMRDKKDHLANPICRAKNKAVERCPLCFQDCREGLRNHLLSRPGCPESKRALPKSKRIK